LSRSAESALRPISNTGIDAVDIDMMGTSLDSLDVMNLAGQLARLR
jgi:hypothetical protein